MPTVRVLGNTRAAVTRATPHRRKAAVVAIDGTRVVLPYAPTDGDLDGVAPVWTEAERVGRPPVHENAGPQLRRRAYSILIAHPDHQQTIGDTLHLLRRITRSGQRVRLQGLSGQEGALWWVVTGYQESITRRQEGTNEETRAIVTLDLTQHVEDAEVKLTPMPRPPTPRVPEEDRSRPRTYTVKPGDTLRQVSERAYGAGDRWRQIAAANDVRDVQRVAAGQRLAIPAIN